MNLEDTEEQAAVLERLRRARADFPSYAAAYLKIRTKAGSIEPLELNDAQRLIHRKLQAQLQRTGKVRAIILKGRQQGASTYIGARFYWKASLHIGKRVAVMTHEQDATDALFGMVERFHEHVPPGLKPETRAANAKELIFGDLDSGYTVATAGNKSAKRGHTIQFFHGSEVAFWPNAADHMAGIGQAVPDEPGTEIVLESTAKGLGNMFHLACMKAMAGESEYELIFVPWFMEAKYRRPVPEGFVLTAEEREYQELHALDLEQMAWRRNKIQSDLAGDEIKFMEEYPATPQEAFQAEKRETLIKVADVVAARRYVFPEPAYGPLVLGVDPARFGGDRTAMVWRRGREVVRVQTKQNLSTMQIVGLIVKAIKEDKVRRVFVDVIGLGAGIVDRLWEMGYNRQVVAVNVANVATEPQRFHRLRDELWCRLRDWLAERPVSIPDHDAVAQDILQPGFGYHSSGAIRVESKDQIRERGAPSPDIADALCLTFAEDVATEEDRPDESGVGNIVGDRVAGY